MRLKAGQMLYSTTDSTVVVVVRASDKDILLTCGGAEMATSADAHSGAKSGASPEPSAGTLLGKRYQDAGGTVEFLCTKAGTNSLAIAGTALTLKTAKPLPASD